METTNARARKMATSKITSDDQKQPWLRLYYTVQRRYNFDFDIRWLLFRRR